MPWLVCKRILTNWLKKGISAYKLTIPTIQNTRETKLNAFQVPVNWEIVLN